VATNRGNRWIFVFGFEKNDRENIGPKELEPLQTLATDYLGRSDAELEALLAVGSMQEICHENKDVPEKSDSGSSSRKRPGSA
jgi:hypothetical protein